MRLRSHGRYRFDPLPERPAGCWPGGSRLAFYVALNLEQYAFGEGLVEDLVPPLGQPDVMNYSWATGAIESVPGACWRCSAAWA
jgi:allantoinase